MNNNFNNLEEEYKEESHNESISVQNSNIRPEE